MAASWSGELESPQATALREHLLACPNCTSEMASLTSLWDRLRDLPAPEPSPALTERWNASFQALAPAPRVVPIWQRPAAMAIAAAFCIAVGLSAGWFLHASRDDRAEVARLREEVTATRQMVALSLMREQSATDRLRGIDYSERASSLDPEVVRALIEAVNSDPNVNVRLAAVDALGRAASDAAVRHSLAQSLGQQDSPMVQAALIDYLAGASDATAATAIRSFASRTDVDPVVRRHASEVTSRTTAYK
jgi:hypothetical protein